MTADKEMTPMQTGTVEAVCISEEKGTQKKVMDSAVFREDWAIEGDAHAGNWHRQVSILAQESILAFRACGVDVSYGDFGENLVVSGLDLEPVTVGTRLQVGEVLLEVTQIGKACHKDCAIRRKTGDCIMPREGIFAVVLRGGSVKQGDEVKVFAPDPKRAFTAAVVTLSDRAAKGIYPDESGPAIAQLLTEHGYEVIEQVLLPDGRVRLEQELSRLADQRQVDVIFTTGGTGLSRRDVTPEATIHVCEKMVPGIGEALRSYSMQFTPHAMLSRQTAGIRKNTLIINLPGSPKACREDLEFLIGPLEHGIGVLRGTEDK